MADYRQTVLEYLHANEVLLTTDGFSDAEKYAIHEALIQLSQKLLDSWRNQARP